MASASELTRVEQYFAEYQASHHHPANAWTHYLGIPAIVVAILGLLSWVDIVPSLAGDAIGLDLGLIAWIAATAFYVWLDWRLGVSIGLMLLGIYVLGRQVLHSESWWALWVLFFGGWVLQFVGHYHFEKKSPAFFNNLQHLLVGPLWIFAKAIGYRRA